MPAKPAPKAQKFSIHYAPNPAQRKMAQAIEEGAKVVLFVGGIRSGKSWGAVAECLKQFYKYKKRPKLGWVVSPTHTMQPPVEDIFKKMVYSDQGSLVISHSKADRAYLLRPSPDDPRTPIRIEFKTATEPDRLRGASVGVIVLDEAAYMNPEVFKICLGRVMDNDGVIIIATTPRGKNWVYHDVHMRSHHDDLYKSIRGASADNPYISSESVERKRQELSHSSQLVRQELEGEFTSFDGLVFTHYDPGTHTIASPDIKDTTQVVCGVDWGYNDPFVCVWCAKVDGVWVVLDEYYRTQTLLADHAEYIKRHPLFTKVRRFWCDPSALQERREFHKLGVKVVPARRPDGNRSASWPVMRARKMNELFARRLKNPFGDGTVPGLVFTENVQQGVREFSSLAYHRFSENTRDEAGVVTGVRVTDREGSELPRNAGEQLEDKDNHVVDALGYAIFSEERSTGGHVHYRDERSNSVVVQTKKTLAERASEAWSSRFAEADKRRKQEARLRRQFGLDTPYQI